MSTGINYPIPFILAQNKNQNQGINLRTHTRPVCWKLHNVDERNQDVNKWREVPYSFTGILNREKMSFLPKLIYQFNEIIAEHSVDMIRLF